MTALKPCLMEPSTARRCLQRAGILSPDTDQLSLKLGH
jgi:hypothetical protein